MAELEPRNSTPEVASPATGGGRGPDEVALELMRFIAVTTGYGKSTGSSAGFSGKPAVRSPEEHADALLDLFEKCRKVVKGES